MSIVYQITNRKLQCQIWLSYILFSALIVFDIFVVLNVSEPLVSRDCMEHANGTDNSSKVELVNQRLKEGVSTRLLVEQFINSLLADNNDLELMRLAKMEIHLDLLAIRTAQEEFKEDIMVTLAIVTIILFNLLALFGLKRRQACLLVPWMIVYLTGFCMSYLRALVLLVEQVYKKDEDSLSITAIFYHLSTAVIFNLAWVFVFTTFKELKRNQQEGRTRPTVV